MTPSGLFPSDLQSPGGSRLARNSADTRALFTMSFTCECLGCLPIWFLQLRPCLPMGSTSTPQMHVCCWHNGEPIRSAQTVRKLVLASFSPRLDIGMACNQSDACSDDAARIRALSSSEDADSNKVLSRRRYKGLSHSAWNRGFSGKLTLPSFVFQAVQPIW